ncbi:MAG: hypothetical protein HXX11_00325 [Desulfuromonadales bacterium]|nr:hypothetical protein [Desulfuromonadales bacterium]
MTTGLSGVFRNLSAVKEVISISNAKDMSCQCKVVSVFLTQTVRRQDNWDLPGIVYDIPVAGFVVNGEVLHMRPILFMDALDHSP